MVPKKNKLTNPFIRIAYVKVNNITVPIEVGHTVLEVCESVGVQIPRFCYHERLAISGNCRMCLVEVKGVPKLAASCATDAVNGMEIYTNTKRVDLARKNVLELLLVNHPLDCPICDRLYIKIEDHESLHNL